MLSTLPIQAGLVNMTATSTEDAGDHVTFADSD
jgi:hypothetical protein